WRSVDQTHGPVNFRSGRPEIKAKATRPFRIVALEAFAFGWKQPDAKAWGQASRRATAVRS
ncbi:hypothetical protein, partial [Streptococcus pneumoniae]|uniref:hypothetical protein n=1 Tax=Streptococcus pneumoniae TaxID=1313 RepID=UPI0019535245